MSQTKIVIVGLAIAIAGIAAVVGMGLALYRFVMDGTTSGPPTEEEQRLVLDAAAFGRFTKKLDPACQSAKATRYFDGSRDIEHKYECGNLRAASTAEIHRTTSNAMQAYSILVTGYKGGVRIGGARLHPQPELLRLGDQHYAAQVRKGSKVVGSVFVLREGKVVQSLLVTGAFTEDPEFVQELFEPLVKEAGKYR